MWYKQMPDPRTQRDGTSTIRDGLDRVQHPRGRVRRTHGAIYSPREMWKIEIQERFDGVLQLAAYKRGDDLQWRIRSYFGEGFATTGQARCHADMVMYSGRWPLMRLYLSEEGTVMDEWEEG